MTWTMIRLGDPTPFCAFCSKIRIRDCRGQRKLRIGCGNVTFESFTRMEIRCSNGAFDLGYFLYREDGLGCRSEWLLVLLRNCTIYRKNWNNWTSR